jgi:hypothetical protein
MVDDWVLFGYDDGVVKISMEKIPEQRVLDTRMSGGESGVCEPYFLNGVHSLRCEVSRRFTRAPRHGRRMHAKTDDERSIEQRRVDLIVEGSIFLLTGEVSCRGAVAVRAGGANLLTFPASGLRGHGRSLPLNPTRASAPLGEGTMRQRRWNWRFLLNLIEITAKLHHRWVPMTHHLELEIHRRDMHQALEDEGETFEERVLKNLNEV